MSDTSLLVPMHLDAMVLNQEAAVATPFLRFHMDYRQLQSFNSPEPPPFGDASVTQPAAGIYLHWTLPSALRHGYHKDDGTTEFPFIPNRWLIVRTQGGLPPEQAVKAWILESDYLDLADGSTSGTSPFVDPRGLNSNGTPNPTKIGRALRLTSDLKNLAPQDAPFLRAVGPGSAIFTTFSPGVQSVLSFYDDVTANDDTTQISQGTLSYMVVGWYADPSYDPLHDTTWAANANSPRAGTSINDAFDWCVYATNATFPTHMLVHASVTSVPWDRAAENPPAESYPTNIPRTVKVAVGHTAIDALAAIVRLDKNDQTEADLLQAFQYSLLEQFDQPGSSEALNMAIRQHWFGASHGGTRWTVVATERSGDTTLPGPPPPVLTTAQQTALAALNVQQAELDRQQRLLESMQKSLFDLWWKYQWQQYNTPPVDDDTSNWLSTQLPLQLGIGSTGNSPSGTDPSQENWYIYKVSAQQNLLTQLTSQVNTAQRSLEALLDANIQAFKAINQPQYYAPNDPVVLVTGLGRATNFDPVGTLTCRLPSQTVSTLTVDSLTYGTGTSSATNLQPQLPILSDPHGLLPEGIQQLHTESVFLSPSVFAQSILGDLRRADAVRQAIHGLSQPPATQFAPISYASEEWQQPWIPLLLDWQVTILKEPAYTAAPNQPTCTFNQNNWQFDGTDYQWRGPTSTEDTNFDEADAGSMTLQGRTFMTPQLAVTLADQLDQYVQQHQLRDPTLEALLQDLDQYIDGIRNQDILSQRLSGVLAMLVEREYTHTVSPSGAIVATIGNSHHGHPKPYPDEHASYAPAVWNFAPLCGTFFVINKLTVIDAFGRTINLMLANYSTDPQTQGSVAEYSFYPIAGRNLKAPTTKDPAPGLEASRDATTRMLQLPPRLVQPSRLLFRLTSNDGQNIDIQEGADVNPICGWLVPNHLDRSLAVYAPDGTAWGELSLSQDTGGNFTLVWQPDPTNPQAPQSVEAIPNSYVSALLHALSTRADNGVAVADFLQVIDETLWTINPRGQRKDQTLSVLIGRPLAIVRATLSLQLHGQPFGNQDWWNTFAVDAVNLPDPSQPASLRTVDGGVFDMLWPVRLGSQVLRNDGLIGYYVDDPHSLPQSFQVFNTVHLPATVQTDYLRQIGQNNNYLQLRVTDDTVTAPSPAQSQVCGLTILVDPRGSLHAFSGLLPVVATEIPAEFVTPALRNMSYVFRAGPFLTSPDAVRLPRPAEHRGTWSWFDNVLATTVSLSRTDGKVRFAATPPLVKEGWLKFVPHATSDKNKG